MLMEHFLCDDVGGKRNVYGKENYFIINDLFCIFLRQIL